MTDTEWRALASLLYERQGGVCASCGLPLEQSDDYTIEIAHRVPRGRIVKKLGKKYEWHPVLVALVCTRKGKWCNDRQLVGAGHPVEEATLLLRAGGLA